ncbi:dehydrogenase E1 component subunit alpha/beta [Hellea balneolensis]|uniref:dehydrogenase E1 component subunit alpha/beta n=1 Tax=Hellea balneolensis TaxID=287478 RepID=UPI0004139A3D|nr:thiamine pyrophosphate-dependent enzyme [Hellea balneolensis]
MDRAAIVDQNFKRRVAQGDFPASLSDLSLKQSGLTKAGLSEIFHAQILSRHLDIIARKLSKAGQGFYTIGSSGHEGNAAIAWAMRPTDMAFLHYRGAAFQIARSRQVPGQTPLWDMLLSFTASSEDPISGGRHKVLGSKPLNIPPQTSTIASHLPKAVGAAFSIGLTKRIKPEHQQIPTDGIVVCSFGDASLNHSTAQGAINTASWSAYQNSAVPMVFVCEDNGIGISTKTPRGWVQASIESRPGLEYISCNGLDVIETYAKASEAQRIARARKKPVFLHMSCIRLYGHAGPDIQTVYLSKEEVEAQEAQDPLLHTARHIVENNIMTPEEILGLYNDTTDRVARTARQVVKRPKLTTPEEVSASLIPPGRKYEKLSPSCHENRDSLFGKSDMRAMGEPQHMAKLINFTMTDLMNAHEDIIMMGEDIGHKGGVYGVTQRLQKRFGPHRMIDTLLDEQSILGLGIGLAHNGFTPMPEIQFLAYLHNAEDQIRGEAATLPFFSNGQFTNPMVMRVAGLGYQRGFGGHFHNDNSLAVLRDIPGLIIACPSNGRDAALMLREAVRLAREEQRIVALIEPIALYMTRDLHEENDGAWAFDYPKNGTLPVGEIGVSGDGKDIAIVSYGNGYFLSLQAAKELKDTYNIKCKVIDLRWLAPLAETSLLVETKESRNILIVDECRKTGSQGEALHTLFSSRTDIPTSLLASDDCFIATGPAYGATMPSKDSIIEAALKAHEGA